MAQNDDDLSFVKVSPEELRRYELREGDVLFNTRNSFELVGKVAVWPANRPGCVYNNNLLRLRFTPQVDPHFAGLLMMSPAFRAYLQTKKSATTSVCAIYQRSLKLRDSVRDLIKRCHEGADVTSSEVSAKAIFFSNLSLLLIAVSTPR